MPSKHRYSAFLTTTLSAVLIAGWTLLAGLAIPLPARGQETLPASAPTSTTGHLSLEETRSLKPRGGALLLAEASPIGFQPALLQAFGRALSGATPRWGRLGLSPPEEQSRLLRGSNWLGPGAPGHLAGPVGDEERSRFGQALIGSAIETAVGGLIGTLLLAASAPDDTRPYENDDREELQGTALLIMLGGPPTGAILNTDIARDDAGAWALSVLGELLLGGTGAGLGALIGGSDMGAAVGALVLGAPGVAVGAAGGAHLAAPSRTDGAFSYSRNNSRWTLQRPTVWGGLAPGAGGQMAGRVSLVTVDL